MKDVIYAKLFEPSYSSKQKDFLEHYCGDGKPIETDIENVKNRLKSQRAKNIKDLHRSAAKFQKALAGSESIQTYFADNDDEACAIIKTVIADDKKVCINNSGTVQEISDKLQTQGIELVPTYFSDQAIKENRFQHSWQLPDLKFQPVENWFSIQKKRPVDISNYDATALIGVNSAASDDGTLFLLQHSSNIEKLLQSKQIIFLVGLEKIVENQDEAKFQTRWAGNFGLQYVLMNLEKTVETETSNPGQTDITFSRKSRSHPVITVIILDNGRSKLLETPFEDVLHCISCRSCISGCPNYKFFGKSLGRYPQQYLFLHLIGKLDNIDLCSYCNNCSFDCPVGIDLAKMNSLAKGIAHSPLERFQNKLIGNPEMLANLTKATLPFAQHLSKNRIVKLLTEKTIGIHRDRPLPLYDKVKMVPPKNRREKQNKKLLIYYPGCWANFFEHDVYNATQKLFGLIDYQLIIPTTKCCGLPLIASGEIESAKKKANRVVRQLSKIYPDADIITTCPSCSLALKKDYIDLGIPGAEALAKRVCDVQEYIFNLEEVRMGQLKFKRSSATIGYHLPCHQRVQNLNQAAMNVLTLIPGLSVTEIDRGCCGISGTFGQKKKTYNYSMETGREMFNAIEEKENTMICTECGPCKMQIVHGTQKKTVHPIALLADRVYLAKQKESK
jgi:glycerol-3-phosphate dehydrogenase subunit C